MRTKVRNKIRTQIKKPHPPPPKKSIPNKDENESTEKRKNNLANKESDRNYIRKKI